MELKTPVNQTMKRTGSGSEDPIAQLPERSTSDRLPVRRNAGGAVFALLVLGFLLRFAGLWWGEGYSYFQQGDGIEAYAKAVDFGRGEPHALYIGQPNYNTHSKLPGPLWTIFCFLGLRLGGSVSGIMLAVIVANTVGLWLIYLLAERTVGQRAALWALLLAATAPWAVYYSVAVYNPNLMSLLGGLLALALWRTVTEPGARSIFWVPLLLLMLPQVHMSGLMMIPTAVAVLVVGRARVNLGWLIGGIAAGLALYVPYVRGEMVTGWQNTRGMLAGEGGFTWDSLKALSVPLGLLVNWAPRIVRTGSDYVRVGQACFGHFGVLLAFNFISAVVAGFLLAGAFQLLRQRIKGFWRGPREVFSRAPGLAFLAMMTLTPLACSLASGRPFHTRYCLVLLPPMFGLLGAAAAGWAGSNLLGFRRVFLIGALVTTAANAWFMPAMYLHQQRQIWSGPVFVPSFARLEAVYQRLKTEAGPGRGLSIDDREYLEALSSNDPLRDASHIRRYVEVRERERWMESGALGDRVRFRLVREGTAVARPIAYSGQGISLVREE